MANRADRRRIEKAAGMPIPAALDTSVRGWDRRLLDVIDTVSVNGVVIPQCVAYSVVQGWAHSRGGEKVYGEVTVTRKSTV